MKLKIIMKFHEGMYIKAMTLYSVEGIPINVPDNDKYIHLQFRRFAGCPVCNLHLHRFKTESDKIRGAGIEEVVLFHSSREELSKYTSDFPFAFVADPDKKIYRKFGVESSLRALLLPKAMFSVVRSVFFSLGGILFRNKRIPPIFPKGGSFGLPADFLIAPNGQIKACYYGRHADDQWSPDQLIHYKNL